MKHWMLLLFTGLALPAGAQTIVSGTITDNLHHRPLEGVSVSLQSRHISGVYTDAAGHYRLSVPKGNYTLRATYLGYTPYTQAVAVQANTSIDITLEEKGLFVAPVEISSLRAGRNAPFTTAEISADDIKKQNLGQDLPFLLGQETSVIVNSDAGNGVGYTGLRIRGSDITRINVTLNGIPVNDAEAQGAYFVDIPDLASSTSSIQIQRGVGTSTNGAGAFGATLNISTNELRDKAYAETDNSYGSFNTWKHTVKAGSGLINDHFTIDARLSMITSDGYIDRATSNLKSFYTSAAYISKKTAIRFNILSGQEKTYQAWYGVPEDSLATHRTLNLEGMEKPGTPYANQTDNYQQDYYQLFLNQAINDRWNFNVAAFLTRGRGYYEEYKAAQAYADYGITPPVYGATTVDTSDLVRQLWLDNYFYGGIFSLNNTGKWLNWSLGGGFSKYDGKHLGQV
ncbi:MAG TPA: TonB-dependent receptor, partial [Chitinophaga sp.]